MRSVINNLGVLFADVKLRHTVFALPFAIMSAFLAAGGMPEGEKLLWIVVAMFGARNAAMAFNRIADAHFDKLNPRTRDRALPSGKISLGSYWFFLAVSCAVFVFASYMLNRLAFYLSPVALAIVFFYSLTKRFTSYSHFWLGLAISVAPVGAWVAIREEISLVSVVLGLAVIFWLVGFDIIYACLDVEADASSGLNSIPRKFGVERALRLAFVSHVFMVLVLLALLWVPELGYLYLAGVLLVAGLLWFEHSLVHKNDLSKVNIAFFNVNGTISVLLMLVMVVDCVWV